MVVLNGYVTLWVDGSPVSTIDRGVGQPICVGCQKPLGTGMVFKGDGAVCRDCLDDLRNRLWKAMGKTLSQPTA